MKPTPQVVIRPRQEADLDELADILVTVHAQDGYPVEGVDDPYSWLCLPKALGIWVVELEGMVAGHVALTEPGPHDEAPAIWARRTGNPVNLTAVLSRLFIAPHARGKGLGSRLTTKAARTARERGRVAVLDVMRKDSAAIETYKSLGWTPIGDIVHKFATGSEPAIAFSAPPPDAL